MPKKGEKRINDGYIKIPRVLFPWRQDKQVDGVEALDADAFAFYMYLRHTVMPGWGNEVILKQVGDKAVGREFREIDKDLRTRMWGILGKVVSVTNLPQHGVRFKISEVARKSDTEVVSATIESEVAEIGPAGFFPIYYSEYKAIMQTTNASVRNSVAFTRDCLWVYACLKTVAYEGMIAHVSKQTIIEDTGLGAHRCSDALQALGRSGVIKRSHDKRNGGMYLFPIYEEASGQKWVSIQTLHEGRQKGFAEYERLENTGVAPEDRGMLNREIPKGSDFSMDGI